MSACSLAFTATDWTPRSFWPNTRWLGVSSPGPSVPSSVPWPGISRRRRLGRPFRTRRGCELTRPGGVMRHSPGWRYGCNFDDPQRTSGVRCVRPRRHTRLTSYSGDFVPLDDGSPVTDRFGDRCCQSSVGGFVRAISDRSVSDRPARLRIFARTALFPARYSLMSSISRSPRANFAFPYSARSSGSPRSTSRTARWFAKARHPSTHT